MIIPALEYYLVLGAALFIVGMLGVLVRRNLLIVFMSIELILTWRERDLCWFRCGLEQHARTSVCHILADGRGG